MRKFKSGASRNSEKGKLDFEGFFSPIVLESRAKYMDKHRHLEDGTLRNSDDWQQGMPLPVYMKSMWRHFFAVWKMHRGYSHAETIEDSLIGLMFNAEGYLSEILKNENTT